MVLLNRNSNSLLATSPGAFSSCPEGALHSRSPYPAAPNQGATSHSPHRDRSLSGITSAEHPPRINAECRVPCLAQRRSGTEPDCRVRAGPLRRPAGSRGRRPPNTCTHGRMMPQAAHAHHGRNRPPDRCTRGRRPEQRAAAQNHPVDRSRDLSGCRFEMSGNNGLR